MSPRGKCRPQAIGIMMLMLLAVLLKASIPAGFMPESKGGFMELVICSGMGEKTILVPADDTSNQDKDHTPSSDHCPYQTLTTAKIVPAPAIVLITSMTLLAAEPLPAQAPAIPNRHIHSIAARGPPSLLL